MEFDYYAALGVSSDAPPEVIRAAYRVLAQKHHPDRNNQTPDAHEITARLNEAYAALSDPERRRAYDEARASSQSVRTSNDVEEKHPQPWTMVSSEVQGNPIDLKIIPGQVVSNEVWVDTQLTQSFDTPFSPHRTMKSQQIPQQRIGVQTARGRLLVQQSGAHIPIAFGEQVEVVQAIVDEGRKDKMIAIINRSAGQWFWVGSQVEVGRFVRSTRTFAMDLFTYIGVMAVVLTLAWALFVRGGNILIQGAFFFFGAPLLLRLAAPLLDRTAFAASETVREKINEVASGLVRK